MTQRFRKAAALVGAAAALTVAAVPVAQARHGADDPVGHDRGDDNGGLVVNKAPGADDPANHDVNDDRLTRPHRPEARHHHKGHHHHHHPRGVERGDDRGGDR